MSRKLLSILACLLMALGTLPALAQVPPGPGGGGGGGAVTCGGNPCATLGAQTNVQSNPGTSASKDITVQGDPTGVPIPISGTVTATLGGFTPSASGAKMTQLAVTTSDSTGTLPTGAVVVVSNTGATNPMFCNVNNIAATASDQLIPPQSWFAFTIPATITALRCIATGGATTADGLGGAGLATGAGGGGGSGGGGGAITAPLGSQTEAASVATTAGGTVGSGSPNLGTGSTGWFATLVTNLAAVNTSVVAGTVPVPLPVTSGPANSVTGAQYNLAITSSTALTVPGSATYAVVSVKVASVNYTTDGATTPTSTVGNTLQVGQYLALPSNAIATNFRAISATGTLTIEYFN